MTLIPGSRLGPYEIVSQIGAGGMGEVYKARDTRLDRTVAVKVLSSHLSAHPQLRERFDREARAISSLSHPHICQLYDVGEVTPETNSGANAGPAASPVRAESVSYLVMEHLEGESLADRLARGPFPVDQVLRYGSQIADALAKAHKHGIVHRDLKPGNVMITKSGAKLLDFGLAKTLSGAVVGPDAPTEQHKPLTAEGTILGTFQYMAPEQLEGSEADARTDIFALGVVLYEMATGRRAFAGKTRTSLIAAIVGGRPQPIEELQPLVPRGLAHTIEKCLEKEPDDRWQSAHDVAEDLKWIAQSGTADTIAPEAKRRFGRAQTWIAAALLLLAGIAAGLATASYLRQAAPPALVHSAIIPPPGVEVSPSSADDLVALSPDGRSLAFTGRDVGGKTHLWLRSLSGIGARKLPATEGARHPFWSVDGQSLAFFARGKLRRIALDGSPPVTICDVASNPLGGTWNGDGTILFSPASGAPLHQVRATGGRSVALTSLDATAGESTHRWPRFLSDGKTFLYLAGAHELLEGSEVNAIYASKLGSPGRKLVLRARSNFEYIDGHLVFVRDETLFAQRFDEDELKVVGQPVALANAVHYDSSSFFSSFSVSGAGALAYTAASAKKTVQPVWLDRQGKQTGTVAEAVRAGYDDTYLTWLLSPDGRSLAATVDDPGVGTDIWLHDLSRGVRTRFSTGGFSSQPVWSPDGKRLIYVGEKYRYYVRSIQGQEKPELFWQSDHWGGPVSWSPDGRHLTLWSFDPKSTTGFDASLLPLFGDRKPIPLAATTAFDYPGPFSPDGRWLLYVSDESGRQEIYAASSPDLQHRQQISLNGGSKPTWAGPREIWYRQTDGTWVSVILQDKEGTSIDVLPARPLFRDAQIVELVRTTVDDRLLAMREIGSDELPQIMLLSGWTRVHQLLHVPRP